MHQKQILAPRMIQSMEILQLPIMELEERIEQEMEENPLLTMQEEDPDLPEETNRTGKPRRADLRRARTGRRRNQRQRRRLERLLNLGEEWSPDYDERPASPVPASRKKETASSTRWPTWSIARSRSTIIFAISSPGSASTRRSARWSTR